MIRLLQPSSNPHRTASCFQPLMYGGDRTYGSVNFGNYGRGGGVSFAYYGTPSSSDDFAEFLVGFESLLLSSQPSVRCQRAAYFDRMRLESAAESKFVHVSVPTWIPHSHTHRPRMPEAVTASTYLYCTPSPSGGIVSGARKWSRNSQPNHRSLDVSASIADCGARQTDEQRRVVEEAGGSDV